MADKQIFEATLEPHKDINATGITVPFDVEAVFGAKKVPVKAYINGAEYRGSIIKMGGRYMLGIPKVFRDAAGINAGETVTVTVEKDTDERIVIVPADLAEALQQSGLEAIWDKMSFTHRKEHARAIEDAKKPETRLRRIEKAIEMLAAKKQ